MHVEFKLPTGAGGQAAHYSCSILNRELTRWSGLYGFSYTTTVTYYRVTVHFDQDQAVTMFALSWPMTQPHWQICED
jgi:hypothetical protein